MHARRLSNAAYAPCLLIHVVDILASPERRTVFTNSQHSAHVFILKWSNSETVFRFLLHNMFVTSGFALPLSYGLDLPLDLVFDLFDIVCDGIT